MKRNIMNVVRVNVILSGLIQPAGDEINWVPGDSLKMELFSKGSKVLKIREYEDFIEYFDANEKGIEESLKEDYFIIHSQDKKSMRMLAEHKIMYHAIYNGTLDGEIKIHDEKGDFEPFSNVVSNLEELGIIDSENSMVFASYKKD